MDSLRDKAVLAIASFLTLPHLARLALRGRGRSYPTLRAWYEDIDGKGTPETVGDFAASLRRAKLSCVVCSIAGLLISALPILLGRQIASSPDHEVSNPAPRHNLNPWLGVATWLAFTLQSLSISTCWTGGYGLGLVSFFAALPVVANHLVRFAVQVGVPDFAHRPGPALFELCQLLVSVCFAAVSILVPRRPHLVDGKDRPVEVEFSVTAANYYTFAWVARLIATAKQKGDLDVADLYRPVYDSSARGLADTWRDFANRPLWASIILNHWPVFLLEQAFVMLRGVVVLVPSYCVLQLLRIIETGDRNNYEARLWAFALFAFSAFQQWSGEVFWRLIWSKISIPVRSQLTALVFSKALRAKDIKLTGKAAEEKSNDANDADDAGADEVLRDGVGSNTKNYSNLIGVDIERVSMFTATNVDAVAHPIVSTLAACYLLNIVLGWRPLAASVLVMILFSIFNVYIIRRYSRAETALMKARDNKMAVVSEALAGIRQIKFSAMEDRWQAKITDIREKELDHLWDSLVAEIMLTVAYAGIPIVLTIVAFATYAYFEGSLKPSVAFSTLAIFNAYNNTLTLLPGGISGCLDAYVSERRLHAYLAGDDIDSSVHDAKATTILFEDASIAWPSESHETDTTEPRFVLRGINVEFPKGKLSVISGRTGSGKSLMLAGILGEADVLAGRVVVPKGPSNAEREDSKATAENWILPTAMAYVAQIPWIENASIRDNILFGLPMNRARFNATIDACALRQDMESFSDGEETEIGSNGINISGGQKWRLSLARAIYSRAGILILDDIFSAVDIHVSRHISESCLGGPLCDGRTVVLVTHHLSLCQPHKPYVLELGDEGVLYSGLIDDMPGEIWVQAEAEEPKLLLKDSKNDGDEGAGADVTHHRPGNAVAKTAPRVFVEAERREKGAVRKTIYQSYIRGNGGWTFAITALLGFFLVEACLVGRSWWVKIWSNAMVADAGDYGTELVYYLGLYAVICVVSIILHSFQCWYLFRGSIRASRALFADLNNAILHAPLNWLDKTPIGRILNRFTRDFSTIDDEISEGVQTAVSNTFALGGIIVSGLLTSPLLVMLVPPLVAIVWKLGNDYMAGARPCKRLSATSMSDLMDVFNTSLDGIASIRAFDRGSAYIQRIYEHIDDYSTSTNSFYMFYRWLGLRAGAVASIFTGAVAAFVVLDTRISPSMAGFGLSFAIGMSGSIFNILRYLTFVETSLSSAERIIEYSQIEPETKAGISAPAAWPTEGRVEVHDLVVGYEGLPPVLKGVSFSIAPGKRVGVIGRTGAGKSSLTLALFRFLEARSGSVFIDGIDISKIKLRDLRSRLAIIPQDPVLFSGTVKSNLDPFGQYEDSELFDALVRAHLVTPTVGSGNETENSNNDDALYETPTDSDSNEATGFISTTNTAVPSRVPSESDLASKSAATISTAAPAITLSTPVSSGGLNLSAGQRQLLCLARAIITRARIVVLDEATSAVDSTTDALIQARVRSEFEGSTLLVVAHRLSTVADFDHILVLSDGQVAEYGSPRELWGHANADQKDWGAFRAMCEGSGDVGSLKKMVFKGVE